MSKPADQPSWVKEFRKEVKASTPKGWLVIQGKKESIRVQIRKGVKKLITYQSRISERKNFGLTHY